MIASKIQATSEEQVISYIRPSFTEYQLRGIFCRERYGMIEASTKAGKTTACLGWIIEETLKLKEGQNTWWVAPITAQADIAFKRLINGLPRGMVKINLTNKTATFPNGATIWFKGADKPDSLFGEDVFAAVIDEASRVKESAWEAIRSTLTATNGPVRCIGNVKGRKNWFFRLCRLAEHGEANMRYSKMTAWDAVEAGILKREEIEDAQRKLPTHIFNELYLAEPSDDGGNPFGIKQIAACVIEVAANDNYPLIDAAELDISWRSGQEVVAWGWDLAKSVDWTVGIGFDAEGRVAAVERFQSPWEATEQRILRCTGDTPALVDSTGVGDPIVERLQKHNASFEGFKFTSPSKQQLMEGLAASIGNKEILYPAGLIVLELEQFEYVYTRTGVRYSAPEGFHDDVVCALALADKKRKEFASGHFWSGEDAPN